MLVAGPQAEDRGARDLAATPATPALSGAHGVAGKSVAAETAAWKRVGLVKKERRASLREEAELCAGEGLEGLHEMLQTPPAVARHGHGETVQRATPSETAQGGSPWQQLKRLSLVHEWQHHPRLPLADAAPIAADARGAPCAPPSSASAGSEGGAREDGLLKTPPKVREMMDSIDSFLETRRRRLTSKTADTQRCACSV